MSKIIPVVFMFAIMLTGATVVGLPDAFASGQGKGNDSDKGKDDHGQKGCENAKQKSKGKTNNPHCDSAFDLCEGISGGVGSFISEYDMDGDSQLDKKEFPGSNKFFKELDTDKNGEIHPSEIHAWEAENCLEHGVDPTG